MGGARFPASRYNGVPIGNLPGNSVTLVGRACRGTTRRMGGTRVSICQHDKRNMEIVRNDPENLGFYGSHNPLILSGKEFASAISCSLAKRMKIISPDRFMEQPPEILRCLFWMHIGWVMAA